MVTMEKKKSKEFCLQKQHRFICSIEHNTNSYCLKGLYFASGAQHI